MPLVREDLVLQREVGPARIDQVDAGKSVLEGDLLGAEMLAHRERVIGAPLDRGVIGHEHALLAFDPSDSGDDARGGKVVVVHLVGGERRELQPGTSGIEHPVDPIANQELLAREMLAAGFERPAFADRLEPREELVALPEVKGPIGLELRIGWIDPGGKDVHARLLLASERERIADRGVEPQWRMRGPVAPRRGG